MGEFVLVERSSDIYINSGYVFYTYEISLVNIVSFLNRLCTPYENELIYKRVLVGLIVFHKSGKTCC